MNDFRGGLEGVVAARTRLSSVDGEAGELIVAGYPVRELAGYASFEELVFLLWNDRRPSDRDLADLRSRLSSRRRLPESTAALLDDAARRNVDPMDALRMAAGTLGSSGASREEHAVEAIGAMPSIVAYYARRCEGKDPMPPREDFGHAENFLYMLDGVVPAPAKTRALDTYLVTVADHGLNASTFTARVIISTESDIISAVTGAVGALKGPLHGGAPGPALSMVFDILSDRRSGESTAGAADRILRPKLAAGERLMGFGHRIYKARDPRADVLAAAAEHLYASTDIEFYKAAREVEQVALQLLEEYKPGRRLHTNVEFYTALLLHGIGMSPELFSPVFAMARVAGWTAHCFEQLRENRIFRPQSEYVGERGRVWS